MQKPMRVEGYWLDRTTDWKSWSIRLQSPEGDEFVFQLPISALGGFREAIDALHLKAHLAGHLPSPPSGSGRA